MIQYNEAKEIQCSADEIFDIIMDIKSYPDYIPGWNTTEIFENNNDIMVVNQQIAFGPIQWRFKSYITNHKPDVIIINSDDKLFTNFKLSWKITPAGINKSKVDMHINLLFSSGLLEKLAEKIVSKKQGNIISLFENRAEFIRAQYAKNTTLGM